MVIPVLETDRLTLRGHVLADFDSCAAMWADAAVVRHFGRAAFSEEESWTRLLRYAGHSDLLDFGYWVLEEKASGKFAGEVGFANYKRDMESPVKHLPEIGWVLAPWAHGRGYATEAAGAAIAWGDAHFTPGRTTCIIGPENRASIRVAEKCGYRELQLTSYKGQATMVFVREPGESSR